MPDFDERLFTRHSNEHSREDDVRLQRFDHTTKILSRTDRENVFDGSGAVRWNVRVDPVPRGQCDLEVCIAHTLNGHGL